MPKVVEFTIDGVECVAPAGQYLVDAAHANGVYIPTLCNIRGLPPRGACRICTVKVNGKPMTACTTPVTQGMKIENDIPELTDMRKQILEALFVEGNHYCPFCEKSGACKLQALAYRYRILAPRFPYQFPVREVDASNPKLLKDHNRCILCKRCIRGVHTPEGRSVFAFQKRSQHVAITLDPELGAGLTDELADRAAELCPVGALVRKERGFRVPIGRRKYDAGPTDLQDELSSTVAPETAGGERP